MAAAEQLDWGKEYSINMNDINYLEMDPYQKMDFQQQIEINRLQEQLISLQEQTNNLNIRVSGVETRDFIEKKGDVVKRTVSTHNNQMSLRLSEIEQMIQRLNESEDIRDQIIKCGEMSEKILDTIKIIKKYEDAKNYRVRVLMLLFQAIKRNYCRDKFTKSQIDALTEVLQGAKRMHVEKKVYLELDALLYDNDLDTISVIFGTKIKKT